MKPLLLAAALAAAPALAEPIAGYDRLDVRAAHRAWPVAASVWYPVGSPTYRGEIGGNAVFRGTPAYIGAGIAEGPFPLILLSHGSGGNMDTIGWLSSTLAARGAMVLAVNHPGSTSGDSSPRRSVELGARAADLSAALDALLGDPAFAPFVDAQRITALGFSLGGATALGLAGIRFDPEGYSDYCAEIRGLDCLFLAKGGVDPVALPEGFGADTSDPRVSAVVAIDPAFTYVATDESVESTDVPALLLNLGEAERLAASDLGPEGSDFAARLADARYEVIAPAHHYTFLAECTPAGAAILAEEGDDPVCTDPPATAREEVHRRIVDHIAAFAGL